MQCSDGIASSARRCENICAAGKSRQHASSQVDPARYRCKLVRKLPAWRQLPDLGLSTIPMDGTLLREENGAIWVVFGGARFHVPDMATLNRLYGGKPVSQLWDGGPEVLATIPIDGTLLRAESGAIWVVFGGAPFHIPDMATLNRLYGGKPVYQPRILGSRISRKVSPSRLKANTVREMDRPGNTTSHQRGL